MNTNGHEKRARAFFAIASSCLVLGIAAATHGCTKGPSPAGAPQIVSETKRIGVGRFEFNYDTTQIIAHDESGGVLWKKKLYGYVGQVRPPHLLYDSERVYVTHSDGVTALDARNGSIIWESNGPADRLLLSGDLLLATDCRSTVDNEGRLLVARATKDGKFVFKTPLPAKDFDPLPIREVAGLFLVQNFGFNGGSLLVRRDGRVCHRFDREVVTAKQFGDDRVVVTSKDVLRISQKNQIRWTAAFEYEESVAGGGLLELPDGSLVASIYCKIADSGVQLVRFNPNDGGIIWKIRCDGLGVVHSVYSHQVTVSLDGNSVKVGSIGSSGTFIELLDTQTGKQLTRRSSKDGKPLVVEVNQTE